MILHTDRNSLAIHTEKISRMSQNRETENMVMSSAALRGEGQQQFARPAFHSSTQKMKVALTSEMAIKPVTNE
jgi:hypothetical protein